ncbi:hypothetical protein OE09_2674 [Flavobacteriaceae bacterium MAR_2010_72]|nr:hypothetical protein OE09_2674 [Flavobacteriaceae bacterium MAR_2010_72]
MRLRFYETPKYKYISILTIKAKIRFKNYSTIGKESKKRNTVNEAVQCHKGKVS